MKAKHLNRSKRCYKLYMELATERVMEVYMRATQRGSADYLLSNQPSEPERVDKILAQAHARRVKKNERNLRNNANNRSAR